MYVLRDRLLINCIVLEIEIRATYECLQFSAALCNKRFIHWGFALVMLQMVEN